MFSIIIPLYNKEESIIKTLKSIIIQTYEKFEIIIINDGSTDRSVEFATSISDHRMTIHSKINEGVSLARNYGVSLAKYEYIAFIDADDYWDPDYLEKMSNLILTYPNHNLYGSSFKIQKNGIYIYPKTGIDNDFKSGIINYLTVLKNNLNKSCYHTSAVVVNRKSFLHLGGFKKTLKSGEDMFFWIQMSCLGNTIYLNEPLCTYNYDVNEEERALYKTFLPREFYIFNLNELENKLNNNVDLKLLIDKLRLKNLKRYYLSKDHYLITIEHLSLVSKSNFDFFSSLYYALPPVFLRPLMKLYLKIRS